jgi:hypothetical protein
MGTWIAAVFALLLSACDDEILTDVDLPKDAAADRAADAPKEGASSDSPSKDVGPDEPADQADGGGDASNASDAVTATEAGDAPAEGGDAANDATNDAASAD